MPLFFDLAVDDGSALVQRLCLCWEPLAVLGSRFTLKLANTASVRCSKPWLEPQLEHGIGGTGAVTSATYTSNWVLRPPLRRAVRMSCSLS